jgi:pyruvate dehydrogenase E2 component (dihydrolipoamide acetyltransferase)
MIPGCAPATCPEGTTGTPAGPASPEGMVPGCTTPAPTTPAAPVTPAPAPAPAAPAPAPVTPTPVAQTVQGDNAPTAGQGEDTPQSDVQGEEAEGSAPKDTEQAEAAPVATAAPSPTEASAAELPFTGVNAWWLGLLGLSVAGTGVVLRKRVMQE